MDMIERVAQAIKSGMEHSGAVSLAANGPNGETALKQFFEVLAMDAIEAMREPTEGMLLAGAEEAGYDYGCGAPVYQAMIDAALGEKPKPDVREGITPEHDGH